MPRCEKGLKKGKSSQFNLQDDRVIIVIEAEIPTGIPNAGSLFTFFIYNWYGTKGFNGSYDTTKSDFL